ncbi:hypothetical protein PMAYCL1PPCAC_32369, partial [Pristionchus mayeri]
VRMAQELSPIEQLPEEILHEIIDNAPESILVLKKVSKLLNDRVDAYVKRARIIRLLDRLDLEWVQEDVTRVSFGLPLDRVDLFKLRLNHFVIREVFPWNRIDSRNPDGRSIEPYNWKFLLSDDPLQYFTFDFVATEGLLDSLNRCIGGMSDASYKQELGEARLYACDSQPTFRGQQQLHFRKLLKGIKICEFHYGGNISNDDVDFINYFIDVHNVDHLNLRLMETTASDPVNALLCFSSRVHSMFLNQYFLSANHWTYMFGLQNGDWADTILAMLGRDMKLETLRMNGMDVPQWLSPASQVKLKQFIPQLERPVSFEAYHRLHRSFADYMDRGYSVRATRGGMSIQYCSRRSSRPMSAASNLVISTSNDV